MRSCSLRCPGGAQASRPAQRVSGQSRPAGGIASRCNASADSSRSDALRAENEQLKTAIDMAERDVGALESTMDSVGVSAAPMMGGEDTTMEDIWTPLRDPAPGGRLVEENSGWSALPTHDGTPCMQFDDSLQSHTGHFQYRWHQYKATYERISSIEGGLDAFTKGYEYYGINRGEHEGKSGIWYREWAPGARQVALVGEFNDWEPAPEHWAIKSDLGVFALFLPDNPDGSLALPHRSKFKARVELGSGEWVERIPAYIRWVTQEWNEIQYNAVNWMPLEEGAPGECHTDKKYVFKYPRPERPRNLRIYECHVGMSSQEEKVNSYTEFKQDVLPRIRSLGYNCVQIMAIQEHAYYGSFGYHVTNFFGVSSRCGTPEELKAMIDEAHRMGLYVLMDIVHSHASKNVSDGINMWDGTDHQLFHSGERGNHWMWDSRLFNYGNYETLRFLLSNSRYWMDEFKFDGYRFDGVTSMMYHHHGLQMDFTGNYEEYFGMDTDVDAVVYLMLSNTVCHDLFPHAVMIGEDVSGMPTFCRPISEGGIGFDYRLNMAIADKWIEVLSKQSDHDWDMGNLIHTMTNRRYAEDCVGYAESHDQALVGDKTIAFWLMDADMYDNMSAVGYGYTSPVVDRGVALHKMVRLLTMSLGGESYLNFMGNEFGHPEWIDFPRDDTYDTSTGAFIPGNGGSYDKCRRRWDLADAPNLRYKEMYAFDRSMMHLDKAFGFVSSPHTYISRKSEGDKVIVVERGDVVLVFNFHPTESYHGYRVGVRDNFSYGVALSSDELLFGGYERVTVGSGVHFASTEGDYDGRPHSIMVDIPSRTATAYVPVQFCDPQADQKPGGVPGLGVKSQGPAFQV